MFFPYGKPDGWSPDLRHQATESEENTNDGRVGAADQGKKVSRAEFISYHLFPRLALQDGFNGFSNINGLLFTST